jgi:hypothetical protein
MNRLLLTPQPAARPSPEKEMMSRTMLLTAVAVVISLAQATPSSAQVSPADMRSGSLRVLTGTTPVPIFTVPAGSVFVLTDIEWSTVVNAGDASGISLNLYGDAVERWRMRGAYQYQAAASFQPPFIQSRFATGLVFNPGDVLTFESGSQLANRSYSLNWSGYLAPAPVAAVGDAGVDAAPTSMQQNAPNPFNPQTEIRFALGAPGPADLRVYDSAGRLVRTLVAGPQQAGEHVVTWDGRNDSGNPLPSGVYYYELSTTHGKESRKALLLK